jgi:NAD(P)-dependent dehydrogenase (short-subunit alcohol dehydrogenase family)
MASYNPLSGVWAYDAAKSATLNLTMAAANEFASYGIRVNAIAPGFFLGK